MMDRSNVIYLVSYERTQDDYKVWRDTPVAKKVYCEVDSISQSEWFEGGRSGLNPALRFRLFRYDYNGEKTLTYGGKEYSIYRTYVGKNETVDLYTEMRKGNP